MSMYKREPFLKCWPKDPSNLTISDLLLDVVGNRYVRGSMGKGMSYQTIDEFVAEREKDIFETEKFKAHGKENDFIFQSLVFCGQASFELSKATTILSELEEVPTEWKEELKSLQNQLHDFKEKLKNM